MTEITKEFDFEFYYDKFGILQQNEFIKLFGENQSMYIGKFCFERDQGKPIL